MKTLSAVAALLLLSAGAPALAQSTSFGGGGHAAHAGQGGFSASFRSHRRAIRLPFGPGFASSPYGPGFAYSPRQSGFASYGWRGGAGGGAWDWGRSEWRGYADPDDRHHRRHHGGDWSDHDGGYYIPTGFADGDGSGYVGTIGVRDIGYFHQDGEVVDVGGGHAFYDYDRGYPYDFYSPRRERGSAASYAMRAEPRAHGCESEVTRDRRSGRDVEVRVCRN